MHVVVDVPRPWPSRSRAVGREPDPNPRRRHRQFGPLNIRAAEFRCAHCDAGKVEDPPPSYHEHAGLWIIRTMGEIGEAYGRYIRERVLPAFAQIGAALAKDLPIQGDAVTEIARDDVLEKAAELLRDPDRVVLDPDHLFETAGGSDSSFGGAKNSAACRVCFAGAFSRAVVELGGDPYDSDENRMAANEASLAVLRKIRPLDFTDALKLHGAAWCADALDEARTAAS